MSKPRNIQICHVELKDTGTGVEMKKDIESNLEKKCIDAGKWSYSSVSIFKRFVQKTIKKDIGIEIEPKDQYLWTERSPTAAGELAFAFVSSFIENGEFDYIGLGKRLYRSDSDSVQTPLDDYEKNLITKVENFYTHESFQRNKSVQEIVTFVAENFFTHVPIHVSRVSKVPIASPFAIRGKQSGFTNTQNFASSGENILYNYGISANSLETNKIYITSRKNIQDVYKKRTGRTNYSIFSPYFPPIFDTSIQRGKNIDDFLSFDDSLQIERKELTSIQMKTLRLTTTVPVTVS